jgi:hypothetical protein
MSRSILLAAAAVALAGCSISTVSDVTVSREIADGQHALIHFKSGSVVQPESAQFRIEKTVLDVETKELAGDYIFKVVLKEGPPPRSIRVDDVSEDPVTNWVDDRQPAFKGGIWEVHSRKITFDDPSLKWLRELDASVRVYRFTIEAADGEKVVLDGAGVYPMGVKEFVRKQMDAAAAAQQRPVQ